MNPVHAHSYAANAQYTLKKEPATLISMEEMRAVLNGESEVDADNGRLLLVPEGEREVFCVHVLYVSLKIVCGLEATVLWHCSV